MMDRTQFPHLTDTNHRITSPASPRYNCVAWAVGDSEHWWEPSSHWPIEGETNYDLAALRRALNAIGFLDCADGELEANIEKIALYGDGEFYTHVARQQSNGKWTSKLGSVEDIEHDAPENVAGGVYGQLTGFMMRRV
jgi:hypothetical protein